MSKPLRCADPRESLPPILGYHHPEPDVLCNLSFPTRILSVMWWPWFKRSILILMHNINKISTVVVCNSKVWMPNWPCLKTINMDWHSLDPFPCNHWSYFCKFTSTTSNTHQIFCHHGTMIFTTADVYCFWYDTSCETKDNVSIWEIIIIRNYYATMGFRMIRRWLRRWLQSVNKIVILLTKVLFIKIHAVCAPQIIMQCILRHINHITALRQWIGSCRTETWSRYKDIKW